MKYKALTGLAMYVFGSDPAAACHVPGHDCFGTAMVAVSFPNMKAQRWQFAEAAIKETIEEAGASYVFSNADSSPDKQNQDIESLISLGAEVIIVAPHDDKAIVPAIEAAIDAGVIIIAYERIIEHPSILHLGFDKVEVGRAQANALLDKQPEGNYYIAMGASTDPNTHLLRTGQNEVLKEAIDSGAINIVGETYTDRWMSSNARQNMEVFLEDYIGHLDAVIASNDGIASGVIDALLAKEINGVYVSGQNSQPSALNRIAKGQQAATVWKDARKLGIAAARSALALANDHSFHDIEGVSRLTTPSGQEISAKLLDPITISSENLAIAVKAGLVGHAELCDGVSLSVPPC